MCTPRCVKSNLAQFILRIVMDLEAEVKQLQEVVVNLANILHANQEALAELREDHIRLRNMFSCARVVEVPSAE